MGHLRLGNPGSCYEKSSPIDHRTELFRSFSMLRSLLSPELLSRVPRPLVRYHLQELFAEPVQWGELYLSTPPSRIHAQHVRKASRWTSPLGEADSGIAKSNFKR